MPQSPQDPAYSATDTTHIPVVVKQLSEEQKKERANTLLKLFKEPVSPELEAYFKSFQEARPFWDEETFIECGKQFTNLCGSHRIKHYNNPLLGLHSPVSFVEKWNAINPQQPVTAWDLDFGRQCPPSWSHGLSDESRDWTLTYCGEGPLSQGLNELLQGPTTLDCAMWCQVFFWMCTRSLTKDELFDNVFCFPKGTFVLTQGLYQPINKARSYGNLLNNFFHDPRKNKSADFVQLAPRIQIRSIFNHPEYSIRHPGAWVDSRMLSKLTTTTLFFNHLHLRTSYRISNLTRVSFECITPIGI